MAVRSSDSVKLVKLKNKKIRDAEKEILFKNNPDLIKFNDEDDSHSDSSTSISVDKSKLRSTNPEGRGNNLQALWLNGGPVRLLRFQGDLAEGHLFFKNHEKLDYEGLKDLILESGSSFLSLREMDDEYIKVRLKTEGDVRKLFKYLSKDPNFDVTVLLDMENYRSTKNKERHLKKLAQMRGMDWNMGGEKDIYNKIDKVNKLEAEIRFEVPENMSTRHVSEAKSALQCENRIGEWNGHIIRSSATSKETHGYPTRRSKGGHNPDSSYLNYSSKVNGCNPSELQPSVGVWNLQNKKPIWSKSYHLPFTEKEGNAPQSIQETVSLDEVASSYLRKLKKTMHHSNKTSSSSSLEVQAQIASHPRNRPPGRHHLKLKASARVSSTYSDKSSSSSQGTFISHQLIHQPNSDETYSPPLISIFDLFAEFMKRSVVNSLETSFEIVKR